jgi:hypothetical protein
MAVSPQIRVGLEFRMIASPTGEGATTASSPPFSVSPASARFFLSWNSQAESLLPMYPPPDTVDRCSNYCNTDPASSVLHLGAIG